MLLNTPIFAHASMDLGSDETRSSLPLKSNCINTRGFSCPCDRRAIQMLLVNQMFYKMATNRSTSDFSIDHILNRAGDRFARNRNCDHYETISMNSSGSSGDESNGCDNYDRNLYRNRYVESERFIEIPAAFDWLNYTRYNMPRIPRPTKGPVKRTPGRLPRIPFTPYQLTELEEAYKSATYLSTEDANKLAKRLELTGVRVKIWFQNRRARDRRERRDSNSKSIVKSSDNDDEEIVVS